MSTQNPLLDLEPDKQQQLVDLVQNGEIDTIAEQTGMTRRQVLLSGVAMLAGVSAGGYSASQIIEEVSAAASTSDTDGNVGLPGDRVDVFADSVDTATIDDPDTGTTYDVGDDLAGSGGAFTDSNDDGIYTLPNTSDGIDVNSVGTSTLNGGAPVIEGGGIEREIFVIASGASDPANANAEDLIFEEA